MFCFFCFTILLHKFFLIFFARFCDVNYNIFNILAVQDHKHPLLVFLYLWNNETYPKWNQITDFQLNIPILQK